MQYDSNQLSVEINALKQNKEIALQQFHKICGAIEMVEAMHKKACELEKKNQAIEEAEGEEMAADEMAS